MDANIFIKEPAAIYHGKAKDYLSSHQLMDFIRCPWAYHQNQTQVREDIKEDMTFLVGRAAHALILEGREVYESEFAIGGQRKGVASQLELPFHCHISAPVGRLHQYNEKRLKRKVSYRTKKQR